ncbi:MAG: bifunctional diaminohydroxyphosphoribosylaminopyrimidine deaminase/5-amino-6-(5-phosphoribosylamino)uracil reductase RibD [Actinomycetota bacterium]
MAAVMSTGVVSTELEAMRHALSLAAHGPAWGVNPRVGCVILSATGEVRAEGWHRGAGTPHAEVDALSKLAEGAARGATAVVTLEPCNHYGRTGPCSEALIAAGIARVVYSVSDPGAASSGGAARLREAGIEVEAGMLAAEVEAFLRVWLTATRLGRPFVSVKWASTLDGRAAAADGTSQWITGTAARQRVHEQREQADAILVGTGTVIADDPSLTARGDAGELLPHQPVPIVIGDRGIPAGAKLAGATALRTHDLRAVLDELFQRGIRHAYVEGGPTLASAFITAGLADEFLIFLAPALLGGPGLAIGDLGAGSMAGIHRLHIDSIEQLGEDLLVTARPATER